MKKIVKLRNSFLLAFIFPLISQTALSQALPGGWTDSDIGSPGKAGSAAYTNGGWTVKGGGADIWGTSDQFNFARTTLNGDGVIIAQVTSLQN
jgi:hypothetical protein